MIDLTSLAQVSQIIGEIEGTQNRDRRRYEWRSYEIYSGDQRKHVLEELKTRYPVEWECMSKSNVNILKKVVDKKSKVYKTEPKRKLGADSKGNDELDRIYAPWNESFHEMDVIFNRHRSSLSWVQNSPMFPTEFSLLSLAPYTYDLVINPDTFEVEVVILNYPDNQITRVDGLTDRAKISQSDGINQTIAEGQQDSAEDSKTYALWSKDNHVKVIAKKIRFETGKVETRIDYIIDESNPLMINPLGILPFVWMTTSPYVPEFPISSPLSWESININVLNSDVLTAMSNSMGQLVLKHPEGSKVKTIYKGHTMTIELPQSSDIDAPPTEAEYINPGSDLNAMSEVVRTYAQDIISDEGIANFSLAGGVDKFASGFDRALAMADVTEIREMNQSKYEATEKAIFEIIKKYDDINKTKMFSADDEIQIEYVKPKILITDKDKLELIEKKETMGLILSFEKHMLLNPGLTEDEAMEREEEIQKEKEKKMQSFIGGMSANKQEAESEGSGSEEEQGRRGEER